ncbi:hypothetical protein ACFL5Z_17885, partial [Planctomycetota bacterium]
VQHKKRSFLKTTLGGFALKFGRRPQKLNKAVTRRVETERSAIRSIVGAESMHDEQNRQEFEGMGRDCFAHVPEDHVEQEKRKKAIGHIDKLIEQISRLQDEIDNDLQTQIRLEQEIIDLVAVNEQSTDQTAQRKRVKKHCKQQADELSDRSVRKSKKRSQRKAKNNDGRHVRGRKVKKKLCLKCKKQKAGNDFHKDKSCKDGLARWCKECKAKAAKKYRKKQTAMKN